jgi:hypothetical protein
MTDQAPDHVTYRGKGRALFTLPMEPYFATLKEPPRFQYASTANYRVYIARWLIEDGRLYLTAFSGQLEILHLLPDTTKEARAYRAEVREVGLDHFFPGQTGPAARVPARWYSGDLAMEADEPDHAGCSSVDPRQRDREILRLTLVEGVVTGERVQRAAEFEAEE